MKPVVLQLIDSFQQGGSERQALQLTRLLRESGRFSVRLACLSPDGPLRKEVESLDLGEIPSFPLRSFYDLKTAAQLRRFARHLRDRNVAVLHTHDFYTNIFGLFAGALARVPVRIGSRRETTGMRSAAQLKAQAFAYKLAHQVIANSEATRQQLLAEGLPADRVAIIHNGLELERVTVKADPLDSGAPPARSLVRRASLAALNLSSEMNERPIVTMVANMRLEVKDHPMFLRVARRVGEAVPGTAFLLAGEGELMPSLRALAAELGLADQVFFLGACDRLAELLAASDVCVLTSKSEGFSNSILEYMAAGRPVVATRVGGAREAIVEGKTGYVVESGDDATMAARVVSLVRDRAKAAALGERGRRVVREKFSRQAQLENTERLYERLLGQRSASDGERLGVDPKCQTIS